MHNQENYWISKHKESLPDFIIGGAMKSGTSTLHKILDQHPDIFIPNGEIHFFDIDNLMQHGDFNFYDQRSKQWTYQSMQKDPDGMWHWYSDKFKEAGSKIKGEDSTTYLASPIAADRIAQQPKEIKLIFLLRQPTQRAFSNYIHLLTTGRAVYSFEDTIRYEPHSILDRSHYKKQLEAYYKVIPADRILVLPFEEMISDTKKVMSRVCAFLDIDASSLPATAFTIYENKSGAPVHPKLQLKRNRWLRSQAGRKYGQSLPFAKNEDVSVLSKLIKKSHEIVNPHRLDQKPSLNQSTKDFLDQYFFRELNGLDQLVGQEITASWF